MDMRHAVALLCVTQVADGILDAVEMTDAEVLQWLERNTKPPMLTPEGSRHSAGPKVCPWCKKVGAWVPLSLVCASGWECHVVLPCLHHSSPSACRAAQHPCLLPDTHHTAPHALQSISPLAAGTISARGPPVASLRPLLAKARMAITFAAMEPPWYRAARFNAPAWMALVGSLEVLIARCVCVCGGAGGASGWEVLACVALVGAVGGQVGHCTKRGGRGGGPGGPPPTPPPPPPPPRACWQSWGLLTGLWAPHVQAERPGVHPGGFCVCERGVLPCQLRPSVPPDLRPAGSCPAAPVCQRGGGCHSRCSFAALVRAS